jgi:hypothetical protein
VSIEGKRLNSLAMNRALAQLKQRHPEEYRELFQKIHNELRVERELLGTVERSSRIRILHVQGEDGKCAHCGEPAPCQQMQKRERERLARIAEPAPEPEPEA